MPQAAIRLEALGRRFGQKRVLEALSLEVSSGESVALEGANGSGKTTLLRILAGLLTPTEGEGFVAGYPVSSATPESRRKLGWVPATDAGFVPRMTGIENLQLFGSFYGLGTGEIERSVSSLRLKALELALRTPYYLCSSGMKQTLALARAMLHDPEVLLLDEPTRSLDPDAAAEFRASLRERMSGKTLFFATHSREEADQLATRRLRIEQGRLV